MHSFASMRTSFLARLRSLISCLVRSPGLHHQVWGQCPKKTDQASAKRGAASASSLVWEDHDSPGVAAHVAKMTHPLKPTLEAVRRSILAADPAITEGINEEFPSFHRHGRFATISSQSLRNYM